MLRIPHCLDNRLTDGGNVVSLTHGRAALYPQEDSWYPFLLEAELTPGPSEAGRIKLVVKSNDLIGSRTRKSINKCSHLVTIRLFTWQMSSFRSGIWSRKDHSEGTHCLHSQGGNVREATADCRFPPPEDGFNTYILEFEVFTVVTMKNAVFWDVAPCFGGTCRLHLQGRENACAKKSVSI
jgi:hypothetical protein